MNLIRSNLLSIKTSLPSRKWCLVFLQAHFNVPEQEACTTAVGNCNETGSRVLAVPRGWGESKVLLPLALCQTDAEVVLPQNSSVTQERVGRAEHGQGTVTGAGTYGPQSCSPACSNTTKVHVSSQKSTVQVFCWGLFFESVSGSSRKTTFPEVKWTQALSSLCAPGQPQKASVRAAFITLRQFDKRRLQWLITGKKHKKIWK